MTQETVIGDFYRGEPELEPENCNCSSSYADTTSSGATLITTYMPIEQPPQASAAESDAWGSPLAFLLIGIVIGCAVHALFDDLFNSDNDCCETEG